MLSGSLALTPSPWNLTPMKRILVLNYEFPPLGGGASRVSYELAKRLSTNRDLTLPRK